MANGDSEVKTLLNFVSLASSDIKAALDRSAPCRRSVDHRKYLQKQLRRFSHRCPALRSGHSSSTRPRPSADTAVACTRADASCEDDARPGHVPMRKRQLPASFWKEPQQSSTAGLEHLLKSSASGIVNGERRKAVFDEFKANPLLSGSAEPPRRSAACACPCCPLQYGRFLLQHGDAPFRNKTTESAVEISHNFLDGLHGGGAHVVIKPIPTKPVSSSSIFSVFGFI